MARATDEDLRPRAVDVALLGLMHGPAELVPISSSGHVTLVPWLIGLPYAKLTAERRKPIEVALHLGTAAALVAFPPESSVTLPGRLRMLGLDSLTLLPTAAVGLAARRLITGRLGTPSTVAAGLAGGSIALLATARIDGDRAATELTATDALVIGAIQSAALWPGVSRSAMTLLATRTRGFRPADSARISRSGIVPAAAAASVLEGAQAIRSGALRRDAVPLAAAAATAFGSTIAARKLATRFESRPRLAFWAVVRSGTAALTILRIRSTGDDA
jgi:undecaprenyl-diphosphatase